MPIYVKYYFWLISVSLLCFLIERFFPWRKNQKAFRDGFAQDLFWLVFNGHYFGILLAFFSGYIIENLHLVLLNLGMPVPESLKLMSECPLWVQFIIFFILKDFIEWNIHRLLHNFPFLWEFHKLHHSIEVMDWIGNFRFHWGEIIIYKSISYLPLVILGVDHRVIMIIAIIVTLIGDLNHSNLKLNWGPMKYILNSPQMHVWHHDVDVHGKGGQNFGIALSIWDWIFGTAYWPKDKDQPETLGFKSMNTYPRGIIKRLLYPIIKFQNDSRNIKDNESNID